MILKLILQVFFFINEKSKRYQG
ncbi:hypothetical protein Nmel_013044 [Mimus melanotis]